MPFPQRPADLLRLDDGQTPLPGRILVQLSRLHRSRPAGDGAEGAFDRIEPPGLRR